MTPIFKSVFVISTLATLAIAAGASASELCHPHTIVLNEGDNSTVDQVIQEFKAAYAMPDYHVNEIYKIPGSPALTLKYIPNYCAGETAKNARLHDPSKKPSPAISGKICNMNAWTVILNIQGKMPKGDVINALAALGENPDLQIDSVLSAIGTPNELALNVVSVPYEVPATQANSAEALEVLAKIDNNQGASSATCDNTKFDPATSTGGSSGTKDNFGSVVQRASVRH
jgi:hypothetical protein